MKNYWELTKSLPNQLNQEVVQDFLLSLKLANKSEGTVTQYRRYLEKFFGDMQQPFTSISSDEIQQWVQKHGSHLSEKTLRFRLSILSSFFTFCVNENQIESSPIKSRWFPRLQKPLPKYLDKEEVAKVRRESEFDTLRNQVLIEFLLSTGCRVSEVHRLDIQDVDVENRTARVIGKGKKIRHVHFTEKCAVLMERYLGMRSISNAPFFVTRGRRRLSVRMIQHILKEMGEKSGLNSNLHPHRLRHTFATELLSKGAELSFIADELGHADIGTTQIYARLPKREIVALYRKYMG